MAPTGPINGSKPPKGLDNRTVSQTPSESGRSDRTSSSEGNSRKATLSSSLATHQKVLKSARDSARAVDQSVIMDLRQAIADGRFEVDPHALAASILGDVVGYDGFSESYSPAGDPGSPGEEDYEAKGS